MSVRIGPHIDLDFGFDLTKQAIPGPADVDQTSFEEVTRATYAAPLVLGGNAGFRVHFDRTNGARNDRFESGWSPDF